MTQKIIKIGTSAAVVIPKKTLEDLEVKIGDNVELEVDKKSRRISIEPVIKKVDRELLDWTKKFIEKFLCFINGFFCVHVTCYRNYRIAGHKV